ncbi:MAG: prephenate dehydratase domain-containing protein [Acidobacteriota bacterium]
MPMRVAIQGEKGAYSECAALDFFLKGSIVPCRDYVDLFTAVDKGQADCMVIPIENSTAGSIYQYYDLLLEYTSERGFRVCGERKLRIRHNLIGLADAKLSQIREVRSHYQALDQCRYSLRARNLRPVPVYDTAGAAQDIRDQKLTSVAAIASVQAAHDLGMKVLAPNMQDQKDNFTRFLWVQKGACPKPKGPAALKTTVAFCIANVEGSLFRTLAALGSRKDVNMIRIESRNLIGTASRMRKHARKHKKDDDTGVWDLVFYVDFTAPEGKAALVIDHLRELVLTDSHGPALQVFGTYPEGELRDITGTPWRR